MAQRVTTKAKPSGKAAVRSFDDVKTDLPAQTKVGDGPDSSKKKIARTAAQDREEISKLSNEAAAADRSGNTKLRDQKINEAREILKPHLPKSPSDSWAPVIDRLDVSTPKDGAVFWSGSPTAAKKFAQDTNRVTLETTSGGRIIDQWDTGHVWNQDSGPPPHSKDLWTGISEKYADGISGDVNLVQTSEKLWDPNTIWHNQEKALVQDKIHMGEATKVTTHVIKTDGSFQQLSNTYSDTLLQWKPNK